MKIEQIECSETSAYKIETPENHPEESIQLSEHGESLKSRNENFAFMFIVKSACFGEVHSYWLYYNIVGVKKSRNINWAVHVAPLKNMRAV